MWLDKKVAEFSMRPNMPTCLLNGRASTNKLLQQSELVKSNDELKKALDVAYDKLSTMEEEIETLKESKKERETAGEAVDDVCSSQHMMQEDSPRRVASSSSSLLSTVRPFDHQGIVSVNKGKETGGIAQNSEIEGKNGKDAPIEVPAILPGPVETFHTNYSVFFNIP